MKRCMYSCAFWNAPGVIDQDLADVVAQVVAHGARDGVALLVDQERGGARLDRPAAMASHCVRRLSRSHCSSSALRPTPAVRMIAPMPSGMLSCAMISRIWSRSSPSMRRETPPARGLLGISTRKRPARLMKVVSAAPLLPRSSFSTCTTISWPFATGSRGCSAVALRLAVAEELVRDFLQRQEAVALGAVIDEAPLRATARRARSGPYRYWLFSVPAKRYRC